jgi:VWFA-related protein
VRTNACLLSIVLSFSVGAQIRENVTVELIEVPVYVSPSTGEAVRGLTKDDFELRVDGRRQPIEYFESIDFSPRPQQRASTRPARERRLYLLLFDANYTVPAKLLRAQRAAEYAVDRSNPDTDLFAVATQTSNKGIQFATPFVSDRSAIRRALHTLSVTSARDPLSLAMSDAERATYAVDTTAFSVADAEMADALRGGAAFQDLLTDQLRNQVQDSMRDLADVALRLAGLQGQKHILYFSSTLPSAVIHGGNSPVPSSPLSGGGLDAGALRDFRNLCKTFANAGVFIDGVDIEGIRHQQGRIEPFNSDDGLQMVSHGTGGTYVHSRNDFGPAINEVLDAQRMVYILAFNRRANDAGTISVRVKGAPRGARVSYRPGFGKAGQVRAVDPLQMADILLHDVPQTGLTVKLTASASRLALAIPKGEVVAQANRDTQVETLLYVFDEHGTAVFGKGDRIESGAQSEELTVEAAVNLPPGRYVAKAIARIAGTASIGFARTEFTVP